MMGDGSRNFLDIVFSLAGLDFALIPNVRDCRSRVLKKTWSLNSQIGHSSELRIDRQVSFRPKFVSRKSKRPEILEIISSCTEKGTVSVWLNLLQPPHGNGS